MHWLNLLPRFLLCAVLVLNGMASAAASITMHQAATTADASGACHTQESSHDCCKAGEHGCQCVHALGVAMEIHIPLATGPHASDMHALSSGHHPPVLPDPIRPPIH
ncbi:MAG: hypothetical protein AB7P31_06235 [Steroidobacteraceae bacterium]